MHAEKRDSACQHSNQRWAANTPKKNSHDCISFDSIVLDRVCILKSFTLEHQLDVISARKTIALEVFDTV